MGKKKSNIKESENGNDVTKLSESVVKKSNNSGRRKASVLASLFFIILIGFLGIILGLIFIDISSSSKDLNKINLKHDAIKKETLHHVKESQSKTSREQTLPPPTPPLKSENEIKMDSKKSKSSDASDIEAESPPIKKQKIEENIVKKSKLPDKEFTANEGKQIEIESQIVKDSPDEVSNGKETKTSGKDKPSKPSSSTAGKSKAEIKPDKSDDRTPEAAKSEVTLKELYIEVEGLADEILQEDPENSMVKELAPHLEGVLRDLEGGKLSGLRDSLLHIKLILSDLKERLEDSKLHKESDTSKLPKPDSMTPKTEDVRVPVDEVIPDPIYIAPLGDTDGDVDHKHTEKPSTLDKVSRVEEKAPEKKPQDQPKKVETSSQPPSFEKEKQQKSDDKSQEKTTKNIKEEVVQQNVDSRKDSKKTEHTEKSKDNQQNINVAKKENEKLKDKIDERSSKKERSYEEKPSKVGTEKRKLSETENEQLKAKKIEKTSTEQKLKASQEKVKREIKSSTVEDKKPESDKMDVDMKQAQKLSNNEELKRMQKDTVTTPKPSSKEEEKFADKSEESSGKLKENDSPSHKKLDEKVSEKHPNKIKIDNTKTDAKESKVKPEVQTLRPSDKEKQTVEKPTKNEKHEEKVAKTIEGQSSTTLNTNEKSSPEPLEVKFSDVDEKLELASALEDENLLQALSIYDSLFQELPKSPTVLYRRALVLDKLSESEQSNPRLEQAIQAYFRLFTLSNEINIPKDILKDAGLRCATRMNFRGSSMFAKEREVLRFLTLHFYSDIEVLNKIGIFYLLMNRNEEAEKVFERALELSPEDGFASVHYGFVLKLKSTDEVSLTEASNYLERGINSNAEGVHDIRMYYHLGDALQRLGQNEKAYQVFDEGVKRGLFKSRYQRSTINIDGLKAKPIWTLEETTYEQFFKKIQSHWKEISREGLLALNIKKEGESKVGYRQERENLREKGSWEQFDLFARGKKHIENCEITPFTCSLIEDFEPAAGCKAGQSKFSVMNPGTHVFPHTGPTNCRLRSHLGLVTPDGARMRIMNDTITWEEGKLLIFDDSFEHEVWHDGDTLRMVLIIDVWHPDLTEDTISKIKPI